jgi:hypothetical protein
MKKEVCRDYEKGVNILPALTGYITTAANIVE